jgi:MFS family permease
MTGALLAGIFLQKFGRKITLLMSVGLAFLSFAMLATSSIHEIEPVLIISRVLQGMSVGLSMASATIYVSWIIVTNVLKSQTQTKIVRSTKYFSFGFFVLKY